MGSIPLPQITAAIVSIFLLTQDAFGQSDAIQAVAQQQVSTLQIYMQDRSMPHVKIRGTTKIRSTYLRHRGSLILRDNNNKINIDFKYYQTRLLGPRNKAPLVLLHSGLPGITALEKHFARFFASRGVSCAISHYFDEEALRRLENVPAVNTRTVKASLATTDYFSALPNVDPDRMALLGLSYGGIRGVYHMALDERLKAAAILVAGTPLTEVMATSQFWLIKEVRAEQMRNSGIPSEADYLAALESLVPRDLMASFPARSRDDFFLVIAGNDGEVPTRSQWQLWESLGQPAYRTYPLGHMGTVLWARAHEVKRIMRFFEDHW